jgi:hypothetical protein
MSIKFCRIYRLWKDREKERVSIVEGMGEGETKIGNLEIYARSEKK